jgi:hypothetical protein
MCGSILHPKIQFNSSWIVVAAFSGKVVLSPDTAATECQYRNLTHTKESPEYPGWFRDGKHLCYQLLAQPFIGRALIHCCVKSEEVIEGLPIA